MNKSGAAANPHYDHPPVQTSPEWRPAVSDARDRLVSFRDPELELARVSQLERD
jgi:hypothetical protein